VDLVSVHPDLFQYAYMNRNHPYTYRLPRALFAEFEVLYAVSLLMTL